MLQTTFFLLVALLFGARYPGGVGGVAGGDRRSRRSPRSGIGGIAAAIALRTGSLSLLQSIFPFVFVLLFTAPAFFPRDLLAPALRDLSRLQPADLRRRGGARRCSPATRRSATRGRASPRPSALAVATTALATLALRERLRTT